MSDVQLAVSEDNVEPLIASRDWCAEPKYDGERLLVKMVSHPIDGITVAKGYNRKGTEVRLPTAIKHGLDAFTPGWWFDGEYVNGRFYVFDIPRYPGGLNLPLRERQMHLDAASTLFGDNIERVVSVTNPRRKVALLRKVREDGGEGVVFKLLSSKYTPGKKPSWRKHKFTDTMDCVVMETARKGKQESVTIGLVSDNGEREVGGCRIPVDLIDKIHVNDVIEVRYLYTTESGKVYQPVFVKVRDDKRKEECVDFL